MSDNENNPDRRWDAGLSDKDLVAFIQCSKDENGWYPAKTVNYFDAKSMRDTVGKSKLGEPKSAGEGMPLYESIFIFAAFYRTYPAPTL